MLSVYLSVSLSIFRENRKNDESGQVTMVGEAEGGKRTQSGAGLVAGTVPTLGEKEVGGWELNHSHTRLIVATLKIKFIKKKTAGK